MQSLSNITLYLSSNQPFIVRFPSRNIKTKTPKYHLLLAPLLALNLSLQMWAPPPGFIWPFSTEAANRITCSTLNRIHALVPPPEFLTWYLRKFGHWHSLMLFWWVWYAGKLDNLPFNYMERAFYGTYYWATFEVSYAVGREEEGTRGMWIINEFPKRADAAGQGPIVWQWVQPARGYRSKLPGDLLSYSTYTKRVILYLKKIVMKPVDGGACL